MTRTHARERDQIASPAPSQLITRPALVAVDHLQLRKRGDVTGRVRVVCTTSGCQHMEEVARPSPLRAASVNRANDLAASICARLPPIFLNSSTHDSLNTQTTAN
jgi:hypothetical protein